MSIKFSCVKCRKGFTVDDSAAGKKGRCKDCGHLNQIPEESVTSPPASTSESESLPEATRNQPMYEVTSSVNGSVFGPADSATLEQWVKENRVTAQCQIKKVGTSRWVAASSVFPQLLPVTDLDATIDAIPVVGAADPTDPFANFKSESLGSNASETASMEVNPFQAGSTSQPTIVTSGEIVPTSGDIGFILSHSFEQYKKNFWPVFGAGFLFLAIVFGSSIVAESLGGLGGLGEVVFAIFNMALSTFFGAGLMQVLFKAGRGEPVRIEDMFGVVDRFFPLVGYIVLVYLVFIVAALPLVLIFAALGGNNPAAIDPIVLGVGIAAFIAVISILTIFMWPGYFLIVDRKRSVLQAFSTGAAIAQKNVLQLIAVIFLSGLIAWVGILAFCIGFLFTFPFGMMIFTTSYLNMSGQISAPR